MISLTDNYEKLCYLLLNDPDGFLISLRFGQKVDYQKVNDILRVLHDIQDEYKNSDLISKELCGLFMDFSTSVGSGFGLYSAAEVKEITQISDKIQDAMRSCVYQ